MMRMGSRVGTAYMRKWLIRSFSTAPSKPFHVCIVGSGPAGFYTAEKMLKRHDQATVDIIERLPTPFGLVRSGVAPDHPETKVVVNQFSRVGASERCSFFGHVCLGKDISLTELRKLYHVVVLAYGAESDRELGIPGENLAGIHSAREFVWWYNGHPDCTNLPVDLQSTNTAVVLGQGNVALDVARILLRPFNELATTDIAEHALAALQKSKIRKVLLVGRRGPVQAACTAKELREILGIEGVSVHIKEEDLVTSPLDEEMRLLVANMPWAQESLKTLNVGWSLKALGTSHCLWMNFPLIIRKVESISEDFRSGLLDTCLSSRPGRMGLLQALQRRGVQYMSFKDWERINTKEKELGSLKGKPREKITSWEELLKVASK